MTIPNILTLLRLIMLPLLFVIFYWPFQYHYLAATVVFTLIGFTDFLDGYLARKLNQFSPFGAFMDPVADKIAVAMCYILITELYQNPWVTACVIVIIGREIAISALREWMAGLGKSEKIAVANIGKWKTFFQMFTIGAMFMAAENFHIFWNYLGYSSLAIATVLTLFSMIHYFQQAWHQLDLGSASQK
jgi:CDP-diacylglycerol--glycerol-3-phosphate 3-phosphatidyltransferase